MSIHIRMEKDGEKKKNRRTVDAVRGPPSELVFRRFRWISTSSPSI